MSELAMGSNVSEETRRSAPALRSQLNKAVLVVAYAAALMATLATKIQDDGRLVAPGFMVRQSPEIELMQPLLWFLHHHWFAIAATLTTIFCVSMSGSSGLRHSRLIGYGMFVYSAVVSCCLIYFTRGL